MWSISLSIEKLHVYAIHKAKLQNKALEEMEVHFYSL